MAATGTRKGGTFAGKALQVDRKKDGGGMEPAVSSKGHYRKSDARKENINTVPERSTAETMAGRTNQ